MASRRRLAHALIVGMTTLATSRALADPPAPLPPPPPPIRDHLRHIADRLRTATATDPVGVQACQQARIEYGDATAALAANDPARADQLAAASDDLIDVCTQSFPGQPPAAASTLATTQIALNALAGVTSPLVLRLVRLAGAQANSARHDAALGRSQADREALRAAAIVRAATHVAIVSDPSFRAPIPKPPPPGNGP